MKILHVIESLRRNAGGAAEIVPVMAEEQCIRGADVTIITLSSDDYSRTALHAKDQGVKILTYPRSRILPGIIGFSYRYVKDFDSLLANADVVHVHGLWQFFGWWASIRAIRSRKRLIVQPHGSLEPEALKISKWKKRIVGSVIERPLLRRANCVLATSESELEHIVSYGVKDDRVRAISLGLNIRPYVTSVPSDKLLSRMGIDVSKKRVLYFSRITPIKGLDLLAKAWHELQEIHDEWQLVITGPDDRGYTEKMKELYHNMLPRGSYVFTGPVYGTEKFSLLKSVQAFVLPTRSENFSLAVAEAMASEVPVVCTKGAPWGIVETTGAGYWVDVSAHSIGEGLKKILSLDDAERREIGLNGRRCVERYFSWDSIINKMLELYA